MIYIHCYVGVQLRAFLGRECMWLCDNYSHNLLCARTARCMLCECIQCVRDCVIGIHMAAFMSHTFRR